MATNQQRPLATNFGTRTHNQSILFIKGRYIRKMELVRVYTKCILSQREIALYTIHTNINYSYILKCHLHFSVPPIQLTRATHKTNNVCLQHFGLRRISRFSSVLKYTVFLQTYQILLFGGRLLRRRPVHFSYFPELLFKLRRKANQWRIL